MGVLDDIKKKKPRKAHAHYRPPLPGTELAEEVINPPNDPNTFIVPAKDQVIIAAWRPTLADTLRGAQLTGHKKNPLAYMTHYLTGNGEELIIHAVKVLRGELTSKMWMAAEGGPVEVDRAPTIEEQQKAREFLANRGWGKEAQIIEHRPGSDAEEEFDIDRLNAGEIATLLILKRKMRKGGPRDITPEKKPNISEGEIVDAESP